MNRTKIDWVKNPDGTQGYTWNPITGCLNHINGMCKGGNFPCYAYGLANGRLKQRYLANWTFGLGWEDYRKIPSDELAKRQTDPFYPRFWEERLSIPETRLPTMRNWSAQAWASIANSRRRGIFVCDMSDLFGIGIPEEWTRRILMEIQRHDNDRFYLLTKQPQNLIKWNPFPDNCWVGVSVTKQSQFSQAWIGAMYNLGQIQAKIKFLSFEPLLEKVHTHGSLTLMGQRLIDWVIIGAQTKPYKPPQIEWVEEIVDACDKAGIPVFLKNNLIPLFITTPDAKIDESFIGKDGWQRQEMPEQR